MEPEDKAVDLAADMRETGLNHIAFDVGPAIEAGEGIDGLKGFLSELNRQVSDVNRPFPPIPSHSIPSACISFGLKHSQFNQELEHGLWAAVFTAG